MGLGGRDDHRAVHLIDEIFVIGGEPFRGQAEPARGFQLFITDFSDV